MDKIVIIIHRYIIIFPWLATTVTSTSRYLPCDYGATEYLTPR